MFILSAPVESTDCSANLSQIAHSDAHKQGHRKDNFIVLDMPLHP